MGLGAGHVADMISRIKQNRAQRPSNRSKFKENNRDAIHSSQIESQKPHFNKVSKEELNIIKNQIREQTRKRKQKERIVFGILIFCGIGLLSAFLIWLN